MTYTDLKAHYANADVSYFTNLRDTGPDQLMEAMGASFTNLMKTVLISAYACVPGQGSEEGAGWAYASTLSQNGHRVHCLTKKDGQPVIDPILASGQFPNLTMHYVSVPNWVDTFCKKGLIGMYFHYIYWQWAASNVALALDKTGLIDLIHHISYSSIQLGSFMYRLGKPFVFGPVGGGQRAPKSMKRYFGEFWNREWMRDVVGKVLEYVNPGYFQTVRKADQLIVANLDTLRLARTMRPTAPIERIWDVTLSATFLPAEPIQHIPGATLKLLWVGRLLPRKALELTIQALGQVDPSVPVTLTIVGGKGEMADKVPGYLDRYNVRDKVDWVGHVTLQQVKDYYEQSDVFFFTSLRDSGPSQLLEAMCYSLPVVTLHLHGQAELVNDSTGIRVPVGTEAQVVADLAKAIEWMYHHPAERLAMGQAGYAFAKTQLWDTKIRLFTERIYPAVLSEPAALAEH